MHVVSSVICSTASRVRKLERKEKDRGGFFFFILSLFHFNQSHPSCFFKATKFWLKRRLATFKRRLLTAWNLLVNCSGCRHRDIKCGTAHGTAFTRCRTCRTESQAAEGMSLDEEKIGKKENKENVSGEIPPWLTLVWCRLVLHLPGFWRWVLVKLSVPRGVVWRVANVCWGVLGWWSGCGWMDPPPPSPAGELQPGRRVWITLVFRGSFLISTLHHDSC